MRPSSQSSAQRGHEGPSSEGQVAVSPEQTNGHGAAPVDRETSSAASGARAVDRQARRLLLLIPIALIVGALALLIIGRFWYDSTYFVMTDNAQVSGDLVQVGALVAGRVTQANLEVGQPVRKDQVIATISVPQQIGSVPLTDQPVLGQTGSTNAQVPVHSPIDGVIAARMANVGGTVTAGQAVYALVDPKEVWVSANIDEDKISRVEPGQEVEVNSVALGKTFPGRVQAVTPASAATFSLLPAQNLSGNFNKVTQWVPVKIAVDSGDTLLPLGTSVSVRIRVKDGGIPWLQWLQ